MGADRWDTLGLVGFGMIVAGIAIWSIPAGLLAAGIGVLVLAYLGAASDAGSSTLSGDKAHNSAGDRGPDDVAGDR